MNLKKAIIFSAMLVAGTTVFAQNSNVRKARTNIAEYEKFRSAGTAELGASFLDKAKEAIDLAVEHEKTKDLAETWTLYALTYSSLANDKKNDEFAVKATEAIAKATELDTDKKHTDNISVAGQTLYAYNFNQGVSFWDKNEFTNAYNSFDKALTFMPGDTTLTYYAAIAAIRNEDYTKGVEKYKQLVDKKDYSQHKAVMLDIPKLYLSLKDTAAAIEYAGLAAKEYPNDPAAATQNIELNLIVGNEAKIVSDIEAQIAKDPTNKNLHYYSGLAYSAMENPTKAYEAYSKAIEIDPNYADANLNAAVVLINAVREDLFKLNENKTLTNSQYTEQVNQLKEKIKPAENHFLKVLENDPKSESALKGLKSLYDFLQLEEKSKEVQAKIDAL